MRIITLCYTLLLCGSLFAQESQRTLPPVPGTPEARLMEAGLLMEKDGRQRQTAIALTLAGAFLGGTIVAISDGDASMAAPGLAIGGLCAMVGLGLNISAAGKAKRAGIILQGK